MRDLKTAGLQGWLVLLFSMAGLWCGAAVAKEIYLDQLVAPADARAHEVAARQVAADIHGQQLVRPCQALPLARRSSRGISIRVEEQRLSQPQHPGRCCVHPLWNS